MGKINRLDEHLSNMIAAGEVVERPMGIVKELVENCIDAHAKNVEIQILQGGIDTITIIDDGDGMDAQDATLAFERHATSKLKEVNDLWNIHTMGFRGEALPSIASVSHVLLRTNNGIDSTEVEINYGKLMSAKPCGTPRGTMIEVKNLFQKTPARFKHLKSPQYEFSLISDVVQKFALSHPEIGFNLSHDGRTIFKTRGNGSLLEVLMQIYGRDTAKTAIQLDGSDNDYKISGYAMQPQFNRATKYYMLMYINGRMIRNYHLQKAIMDAYSHYLPKERYPIVVMNMEMDAQLVDVNVHPSKWEIRLSKEKQLEKLVYETISEALKNQLQVPEVKKSELKKEKVEIQEFDFTYEREEPVKKLHDDINDSFVHPQNNPEPIIEDIPLPAPKEIKKEKPVITYPQKSYPTGVRETFVKEKDIKYQTSKKVEPVKEEKKTEPIQKEPVTPKPEKKIEEVKEPEVIVEPPKQEEVKPVLEPVLAKNPSLPQLQVIGQFHNCYIIAQGEKGLYIIDQHAAQERYHYEIIRKQILEGVKDTQPLLLPITIESSISAVSQVDTINAMLEQLGIHLDVFGNNTFIVRELPVWMKDTEEEAFIRDMIDYFEQDNETGIDKLRKHAIATMACHSSIRFHRTLTMEEMKQVIADLGKCEQPFHCPHGRPTLICLSDNDLIKEFERG
ncbi:MULTISPECIES: DNA mismatch repair endonuclease MutL [Bacillota]|jgi:DNA mismatch repair protein MutL|uniref:DNA mismatch repair protein MutL n=2 Tax=Amedibacillus TaxID=2749846 RepID=A0A7G9GRS5_9FIRM|nr:MULTISPECIES: DNA mismatch repair endonuclease MutL [Bacillota]QNM13507.1 DNA mismatch repair endonuclease MutL [[Eubacterium] hominis]MCH4286362.1 DNA mismatch repair endonuclease MutL [Amedibacillus hominis]RGB51740.1 DNA mismatch repair endonuclease MutL [Absiella sp. AM22-9]RGB57269.1 DNA mismatch repair endonuclease MutL [Absiella sp. AM10-20]RGB68551.1 DNA mismatch repair endonuclease MutL [Absiella sp. AM09-45]